MKYKLNITMDIYLYTQLKYKTTNISGTIEKLVRAYIETTPNVDLTELAEKEKLITQLQAEIAATREKHEKELKETEEKTKEKEVEYKPQYVSRMDGIYNAARDMKANNWKT